MEELTAARKVLRFGLFEVDFDAQELRKSGIKIKIQDQPFQILALLLERPGQIVTREEIQKRLWVGDTFVDFDLGLNSAVKKLRQALGDESDNPRFVETLYRRGYRFLAPVQDQAAAASAIVGIPPLAPGNGHGQEAAADLRGELPASWSARGVRARRLFGYILLPLLLGAGLAAGYWLRPPSLPRISGYQQITHDGRQKHNLASDGERIYVGEFDSGRFAIAQVSAAGGETSIFQTPFTNVMMGGITPDSSALLVGQHEETNKRTLVWSLPLPTGAPRRLGDLVVEALAPSPDGKWIVFSKQDGLYETSVDGSQVRKLFDTGDVLDIAVSPDGRKINFTQWDPRTGGGRLWEANRDGSDAHPLFPGEVDSEHDCCAQWTPDGKYLFFGRYSEGHENIWVMPERARWFSRKPRAVQLTNGPLDFKSPLPSRDGKRLFAVGAQPRTELLRYDPNFGFKPFLGGVSVTDVAFSADSQWITYVTVPDDVLWRSHLDGSERMQLTDPGKVRAAMPRWSPDGKRIVFMGRTANANWHAFLISANGGAFQDLLPSAPAGMDPGWTPDGKSVVVTLNDLGPTGQGISIVDLQSRETRELPGAEDLFSPRVSPDGKFIAALTTDSQALMLYDLSAKRWTELVRMPIGYPSWSHNGQYLYFDTIFSEDPAFYRVRISDHKLERITGLSGIRRFWGPNAEWTGLAPDDSLLLTRDASNEEVYAIDWQPN